MNELGVRKGNPFGLILLYVILSAAGSLLSIVYILANYYAPLIYLNILFVSAFAGFLAFLTKRLIKSLKINSKIGACIAVFFAILTFSYFKWNIFYGIHYYRFSYDSAGILFNLFTDIDSVVLYISVCLKYPADFISHSLYFNEIGTWYYGDESNVVTGVFLWAIWAVEFGLIAYGPLAMTFTNYGYLVSNEKGETVWAEPEFAEVPFEQFDEYDYGKLEAGNLDIILDKPVDNNPDRRISYRVAFYKVYREHTGVIAVYKFTRFNGKVLKSMFSKPFHIGKEQAEELQMQMSKKYITPVEYFNKEFDDNTISDIEKDNASDVENVNYTEDNFNEFLEKDGEDENKEK